jgi:HEPN domain-containing protein
VFELLDGLPDAARPDDELLDKARILDRFYIPPRYADAHPSGPPYQYYTGSDADQAVGITGEVVGFCEHKILHTGPEED